METFTVKQAAAKWIGMVEAHTTATPEAKVELIAKISAAIPMAENLMANNYGKHYGETAKTVFSTVHGLLVRAIKEAN